MRVERGSALLATLFVNSKSKTPYKIYDFMPHEDEPPIDLESAMKEWG